MPDDDEPLEPPTIVTPNTPAPTPLHSSGTARASSSFGAVWEPPSIEEAAQLFPNYEVISLLGRGGMGAVYQARQVQLDRFVAIKLLPLEISADQEFAERFRREARAMAKLSHPNIISVYDFGVTSAGHLFFVMEFIEGANLHSIIHGQGLNADQALWLAGQVCTALAYAHGKGVVHRDIKPANVMVDMEGNAKVADFGLARLTDASPDQFGHTQTGMVMGTPDYMAPEQKRGMHVDHRADIYSLGVMLYEMLCRETPQGIFETPSVRTGCDPRIDDIVVKAMQSTPERRYQSTQEMQAEVEAARTPLPAPRPRVVTQVPRAVAAPVAPVASGPSKTLLAIYAVLGVALVAVIGAFVLREGPKAKRSSASAARAVQSPAAAAQRTPPIDLIALADPARDHMRAEGLAGMNQWTKDGGRLLFKSVDQKSGKISAPVALNGVRDYELDVEIGSTDWKMISLDFPTSPTSQLTLDFSIGGKIQLGADDKGQRRDIGEWPPAAGPGLHLAGRIRFDPDGTNGTISAMVNDKPAGSWHGPLTSLRKKPEPHPDFPGMLVPALFVFRGDREFKSWTLRVFEGEAKMLQRPPPPPGGETVVDLLPIVDPVRDAIVGNWRKEGGKLTCEMWGVRAGDLRTIIPQEYQAGGARLELPYEPPEEYDFRIKFTWSGRSNVDQILTKNGRAFTWAVGSFDNRWNGFSLIAGKPQSDNQSKQEFSMKPGETYTSDVQVRNNGLKAFVNGKPIVEWKTDYSDLSQEKFWQLRDDHRLGIGAWASEAIFTVVEVREVRGHGRMLRPGPPGGGFPPGPGQRPPPRPPGE